MRKTDFNKGWHYRRFQETGDGTPVTLPHDAMAQEPRSEKSMGGRHVGWFEACDYVYTKHFSLPEDGGGKVYIFEFEGIHHHATVYLNGRKVAYRPYGYTNFYVDAGQYLLFDQENEMRVEVRSADQPNSRWYTGAGLYRPVFLYEAEPLHILPNGIKIRTLGIHPTQVEVRVQTSQEAMVSIEILNSDGTKVATQMEKALDTAQQAEAVFLMNLPSANLWDCAHPHLYHCRATCEGDVAEEIFGIRTLAWNECDGLTINGKREILRGACIHHDNGLLGACAFPQAEERKVRLLKEAGYNAIRSAHNPCSKALLSACDRLGMYMMDEYSDMWYIHKTEYDYAGYLPEWWQRDLQNMVEKDYNHPCVVIYSTGNEVSETSQKRGIAFTKEMTDYLHKLDDTRPVTCGINIFFNFLASIGFGVYRDDKAQKEAEKALSRRENKQKTKPVGSEFYNTLAGLLGDTTMKVGAMLPPCDWKTKDAFAHMDIAGYNYGIFRYSRDLKKYPERLIIGTETFCSDAYRFWEHAKNNNRILGDFVWAGMDYMGEAGVGAWEYADYAPPDASETGWLTAGSGRLNILGVPLGEAAYTRVAFQQDNGPIIAVRPVYQRGKHTPSAWKMTNAMQSWAWHGCSGWKATVEVYARAAFVKLWINGKPIGKRKLANTCRAIFHTTYQDGEITAASYDDAGNEIGRQTLQTAGEDTRLQILPEEEVIPEGGLAFVHLRYTDENGLWKPMEKHNVQVKVTGGSLLGLGNGCPYNPTGYRQSQTPTYYGEAMAVVQASGKGPVRLTINDNIRTYHREISVLPV